MNVHRIPQSPTVVSLRTARATHPRDDGTGLRFGRCRLLPAARLLLRDDREVALGDRAFDLLLVFIGAPGRILSKAEITAQVWPTTRVEESNLRFQICGLRRALGPDGELIRTIAGRGYLFAGVVEAQERPTGRPEMAAGSNALQDALAACDQLRVQLATALAQLS